MTDERLPTKDEQWARYKRLKAAHDEAMQRWKDGGRVGNPPPRPVPPHTPGWRG